VGPIKGQRRRSRLRPLGEIHLDTAAGLDRPGASSYRAVFSFQQTLDGLNSADVPNLDKARLNVWEFVHEIVERLKAVEQGGGREKEDDETSDVAGAA
jgi:hypothetical protein